MAKPRTLIERLAASHTGPVHDALRAMGHENIVAPPVLEAIAPSDIVGRWIPGAYGEPVTIWAVTISTGDWRLGDRDGVVVIRGRLVEEVVAKAEEVLATESEMRKALVGGMDPVEAYNRFGKF
jgi:hypothetical protein